MNDKELTQQLITSEVEGPTSYFARALPELRFVLRDGERILQQAWHIETVIKDWPRIKWRDVPLVEEGK